MPKYVKSQSIYGGILYFLIRFGYLITSIFVIFSKKSIKNFEENPIYMSKRELLHLGYIYYVRPILYPENDHIQEHFKEQEFKFIQPKSTKMSMTMTFCGDILPYKLMKKNRCRNLWSEIGDSFFSSDLNIANLETPIDFSLDQSTVPEITFKKFNINGSPEFFEIINGNSSLKGFDLFSTANNHSLDMGIQGVINTIEFLEKNGVSHCGTFRKPDERRFTIIEKDNFKIGFIAYTFSLNYNTLGENESYHINYLRLNKLNANIESIRLDIENARNYGADFVVLLPHFGLSYHSYPSEHIISIMHRLAKEAKPNMIIANHSHIPQQLEMIDGNVLVAYSLGDFIGYDITNLGKLSLILEVKLIKNEDRIVISDFFVRPIFISKILFRKR